MVFFPHLLYSDGMKRFTEEPVLKIIEWIRAELENQSDEAVEFEVFCSDEFPISYSGELVDTPWGRQRVRNFQNLVELAEIVGCHLRLPQKNGIWMQCKFVPRNGHNSWHSNGEGPEKYGVTSDYHRIQKLEDPAFVWDMKRALVEAGISTCNGLIDLGVNTGDELELVHYLNPDVHCTGIDYCSSAIDLAKRKFIGKPFEFIEHNINELSSLHLHRTDILMSLGTLHSPGVDSKRVFMECVQQLLKPQGSVIVGFPNCRWIDGQAVYGAKMKNRRESDMSLVIKDLYFIKKYLQQHRFSVTIFGKYYLWVVGVKRPKSIL